MNDSRSFICAPLTLTLICAPLLTRAANFTAAVQQGTAANWSQAIWQPGPVAPTAGNTYECLAGGNPTRVRNPNSGSGGTDGGVQTFPGDSLQLDTGSEIRAKGPGGGNTIDFPGVGGNPGLILNGGNLDTGDNFVFGLTGIVLVQNNSSFSCGDTGGNNTRGWRVGAQIRGNARLQVTKLFTGGVNAVELTGSSNPFNGDWVVLSGGFKATGSGSLGNSRVIIAPTNAALVATPFEVMYDVNSTNTLTITNGGTMFLHQNCTWSAATINGMTLTPGTHPYSELSATFPSVFVAGGSGSIAIPAPAPPTTAPTNIAVVNGDAQVSLSWVAVFNAAGYLINRSSASGGPYTTVGSSGNTNFVDSGVVNGSAYYYVLMATNALGAGPASAEVVGNPNLPVTGITAVGGTNQVTLNWSALANANSYSVLRAVASGGPFTAVTSGLAGTSYIDAGLQSGRIFYYRISASLGGGGTSGQSAVTSALTAAGAPVLTATRFATNVIRVGWTTDPVVSQFFLERSPDGVSFSPLVTLAGNVVSYTNTGLSLNSAYYYRVRATNATGPSDFSNIASTNTPTFGWNVNFGAGAANSANAGRISPIPPGYLNDIGDIFGDRTNGCFYGWTNVGGTNIVTDARWRQNGISPDLRYDTFIHLMKAGVTNPTLSATWEIQVPNGPYVVHIVSGDSDNADAAADHFQFIVEGVATSTYIPGTSPTTAHWGDHTVFAVVTDGRLSVTSGSAALNNKIAFIDIYPDIPVTPIIGTQPQPVTSEEYRPVSLSVGLSQGSQPLRFQWYFNNNPLNGATNQTLTFSHVRETNEGSYFLIVTNYGGAATSSMATITVNPDTTIPYIVSAGTLDQRTVGVCFNEELDNSQGVATEAGNYSINNNAITVLGVTLRPDGRSVALRLQDPVTGPFSLGVFSQYDLAGNYLDFAETNVAVLGFSAGDVGGPSQPGSNFTCDNQNIEVVGGGADFGGTGDQGYLATKSISGDFDARVRVNALAGSNALTRALLVARESADSNSAALHIFINPPSPGSNQIGMALRPTTGAASVAVGSSFIPAGIPNAWMRITRVGNLFTGYRSTDGATWTQLGQSNVALAASLAVGIGVTAHDNTLLATGMFNSFSAGAPIAISASAGTNGSVSPNGAFTIGTGASQTFTATPNAGYVVDQWSVDGSPVQTGGVTYTLANIQSGHSVAVTFKSGNTPPTLAPIGNHVIHAGSVIILAGVGSDSDVPTNLLTYSLAAGNPNATVDPNDGYFIWQTTPADAGTTNNFTVRVTDNGSPALSDSKSFTITVVPAPRIRSIASSHGTNTMVLEGAIDGGLYNFQYTADLPGTNVVESGAVLSATGGLVPFVDDTATNAPQRFYYGAKIPEVEGRLCHPVFYPTGVGTRVLTAVSANPAVVTTAGTPGNGGFTYHCVAAGMTVIRVTMALPARNFTISVTCK